jgi:uncharacterized protein YidB (DUF937 family)
VHVAGEDRDQQQGARPARRTTGGRDGEGGGVLGKLRPGDPTVRRGLQVLVTRLRRARAASFLRRVVCST